MINPKKIPGGKKAKKGYKNSGVLSLLSITVEEEKGFVEYLSAGLQMNFSVAIDFTASNGVPSSPTSLHYMNPYQLNPYGSAIKAVGEVIADYDNVSMAPSAPGQHSSSHSIHIRARVRRYACMRACDVTTPTNKQLCFPNNNR